MLNMGIKFLINMASSVGRQDAEYYIVLHVVILKRGLSVLMLSVSRSISFFSSSPFVKHIILWPIMYFTFSHKFSHENSLAIFFFFN